MRANKSGAIVAAGLAVLAGALAFLAWREARAARAALAAGTAEHAGLQGRLDVALHELQLARQRVADAEKDNGELLRAVEAARVAGASRARVVEVADGERPLSPAEEQRRLAFEREYQQGLAKKRAGEVRARAELAEEVSRLDPVAGFNRRIAEVERLLAAAEFQAGLRLLNQAMNARPAEAPITDRIRQLQASLLAENYPVSVSLRIPEETWVMIPGYRALGKVSGQLGFSMPPGNYEIVARRDGFLETRIPLEVRNGTQPIVVRVDTDEPVRR